MTKKNSEYKINSQIIFLSQPQLEFYHKILYQLHWHFYLVCQLVNSLPLYRIYCFTYLKVCLATVNHSFKLVQITHICLIGNQTFVNRIVKTPISFPITMI